VAVKVHVLLKTIVFLKQIEEPEIRIGGELST
jgi:hypothetical protein